MFISARRMFHFLTSPRDPLTGLCATHSLGPGAPLVSSLCHGTWQWSGEGGEAPEHSGRGWQYVLTFWSWTGLQTPAPPVTSRGPLGKSHHYQMGRMRERPPWWLWG